MAWIHRAAFFGAIAEGDHAIELLAGELVDRFRAVSGNIDSEFAHDRDGLRPNVTRTCAGAGNFKTVAGLDAEGALQPSGFEPNSRCIDQDSFHVSLRSMQRRNGHRLSGKYFWNQSATFTRLISTGTSTSGPITAAKAAPELIPNTATATAIASSKLLLAAVKDSVAVFA